MVRQDRLRVKHYLPEKHDSKRVIVDFDPIDTTDRFLSMDNSGGVICIGAERVALGWEELVQIADVIKLTHKSLT